MPDWRRRWTLPRSVEELIARDATATLSRPHVVHVFDNAIGLPSAIGPFPDGISACEYAARSATELLALDADLSTIQFVVIPLDSPQTGR